MNYGQIVQFATDEFDQPHHFSNLLSNTRAKDKEEIRDQLRDAMQ